MTSSFIPVFTRCREVDGEPEARRLAGGVLTLMAAVLIALLLAAEIALLIVSRFTWNPTLNMAVIMLPYMVLICLTAFYAGLLNVLHRFGAPAIAPMILNVVIILAAVVGPMVIDLSLEEHLKLIACAIVVGGVLQLASQVLWLRTTGFSIRINFAWSNPQVRRVMTMMAPMILGMSAVQINSFADSLIALLLVPDGRGPAVLGYSQYLYSLPLGIFSLALATAIFPLFARYVAKQDMAGFARGVEDGLRTCIFIALPAGVGLMLIGTPLIRTLFEHGQFDPADTTRVVWALSFYCLGIWAYSMQHILIRAFYSMEDSRAPMRIAMIMVCLNLGLNFALVFPLREAGVALATALTACIQVVWLGSTLKRRLPDIHWAGIARTAVRAAVATGVMALLLCVLRGWSPFGRLMNVGSALELAICVAGGALAYFVAARIVGLEELNIIFRRKAPR